jgi:hypothetical protein
MPRVPRPSRGRTPNFLQSRASFALNHFRTIWSPNPVILRSQKKNRIVPAPRPSRLAPMRLAQVGLGSGGGPPGNNQSFLVGSASYLPTRNATQGRLPEIPWGDRSKSFEKTPLRQPPAKRSSEQISCKHRLPQARCPIWLTILLARCCCRGQVKSYFANSPMDEQTGSHRLLGPSF